MVPVKNISKSNQVFFIIVLLLAITFTSFILHQETLSTIRGNIRLNTVINVTSQPLKSIILLWTWPFKSTFPLNQCPQEFDASDCLYTLNRSMYSLAKAVILHHRNVCSSRGQLPQIPRPPDQYWIWFNLESPSHSPNMVFMDNLINLTMTYRVDSDIHTPYGWLITNKKQDNYTIPRKSKLVAWVVSNWNKRSRRVNYYNELKPHLDVDIFGRLHMPLPRSEHYKTLSNYKFYLAFENSIHQDYITEKFWKTSFTSGAVPVVMGPPRQNYERFVPPDSFIHVDDFKSAKELASYLHKLDEDDQKYKQYFKWRTSYEVYQETRSWVTEYCKVCKALKEVPVYRTIPSIAKWFT
uniref:Fucosyltransferase n=1 Tax=Leptobrachium leishanense TaxID=445787 RepID=A0A8C5PJ77_9ANUR